MRQVNHQPMISTPIKSRFIRALKLAAVSLVFAAALVGCASFERQSGQGQGFESQSRSQRAQQNRRYSVMDDWFWRSRYFDHYYSAAYSGYGIWNDPWLMWTLRSGRYGGFGHWQFDPFYSPWRGFGYGFGSRSYGFGSGWGHGYPYFGYSNYGYPIRIVNGRGLASVPNSTENADRALLLLRQSERRNAPDYGSGAGNGFGAGFPGGSADWRSWTTPSRQDRAILQMETPRRDDGGLPRTEQRESAFPSDLGRGRERDTFERSERSFERSEPHRERQDE